MRARGGTDGVALRLDGLNSGSLRAQGVQIERDLAVL